MYHALRVLYENRETVDQLGFERRLGCRETT